MVTLLQPLAIRWVLLEFGPMSSFGERVAFDVGFVFGTKEKGSWVISLSIAQQENRRIGLTVENNIRHALNQRVLFSLTRKKSREHALVVARYGVGIAKYLGDERS